MSHSRAGRAARRIVVATTVTALAALAVPSPSSARSAGDLDPSFGTDGVVDVGGLSSGNPFDVVVLPDGRLQTQTSDYLVRLNADGTADSSFGVLGVARFPEDFANPSTVVVDSQGRTLVAGSDQDPSNSTSKTALLRLLPDGSPDPSFGGDGVVSVDVDASVNENGTVVLIQPDGKYVVAGTVADGANESMSAVRVTSAGAPDATFGGDGAVVVGTVGGMAVSAEDAVLIGTDLLVGGHQRPASDATPAAGVVVKIRADGTLDPAFSGDGIATTPALVGLVSSDLVALPDGRLRQVGSAGTAADLNDSRGVLSGLSATGAPDLAVGPGGQRTYDLSPGTGTRLTTMATSNNALVVAGALNLRITGAELGGDLLIGRLTLDGAPDPTFSQDGYAVTPGGARPALPTRIVVDAAGRLVTASLLFVQQTPTADYRMRVARYLAVDDPAPTPPVTPPTTPTAKDVIRLPGSSKCVAGGKVRLKVVTPPGIAVTKVTAKVGSGKARTVKPPVKLALPGRPRSKVKVVVAARLDNGVTLKRTETYKLCG